MYCHQADAVPGMQACADCFYKRQMRRIAKSSPQERAKQAEYRRQWRAKHKAEGLCSECNQPVVDGTTRCKKHQILHKAETQFHKVHVVPDLGKCSIVKCNEPAMPGKRFCAAHYQMKRDVAMSNKPKSNVNHIWRRLDGVVFRGRRKKRDAGRSAD